MSLIKSTTQRSRAQLGSELQNLHGKIVKPSQVARVASCAVRGDAPKIRRLAKRTAKKIDRRIVLDGFQNRSHLLSINSSKHYKRNVTDNNILEDNHKEIVRALRLATNPDYDQHADESVMSNNIFISSIDRRTAIEGKYLGVEAVFEQGKHEPIYCIKLEKIEGGARVLGSNSEQQSVITQFFIPIIEINSAELVGSPMSKGVNMEYAAIAA